MPERHAINPTIGLLLENLTDSRFAAVWRGALDALQEREGDLRCFCVGSLQDEKWTAANTQRVLGRLIDAHELDGLVTFQWWRDKAWFEQLCRPYQPLPIVNIMRHFEGYPGVRIDNRQGMRYQLQHAIDVHGCRKIAYMPGSDSASSCERFQAYQDILQQYDIPFDPSLVVSSVDSSDTEAAHARSRIRTLLDERQLKPGRDFDAISTFNDAMALGAIEELQRRGIHVPGDVAVIGFNNREETDFSPIPLTTIAIPWYDLGKHAAEMVLEWIDSGVSPGHRLIAPRLVVRRSCGCHEPEIHHAGLQGQGMRATSQFESPERTRNAILHRLHQLDLPRLPQLHSWKEQLVDSLLNELRTEDETSAASENFLEIWEEGLRQIAETVGNLDVGQDLLSLMIQEFRHAAWAGPETLQQVETLCQQGRILLHKLAQRTLRRQQAEHDRLATIVRQIGQRLITTFDLSSLMDILAEELPRLGIQSCYLSLYDNADDPGGDAHLLFGYNTKGRIPLPDSGVRFPATQCVPKHLVPRERRRNLVLEALFFGERQLGFAGFGNGPRDGELYHVLRAEISSALQGAFLVEELQQYRQHLEELVDDRTTQLRRNNEQLHQSIRERVKAEQALRSSEQQYRSLAEHVKDGIAIIQHEKIVFSNAVLAGMLEGGDPAALLRAEAAGLDETRVTGPGSARQFCLESAGGREIWTEIESTPIIWNSEEALLMTVRNITSRKLKEQQLEEERVRLHRENMTLRSTIKERFRFGALIGKSPAMQKVYELIMSAAASDVNALVLGESGTGKELIARTLHRVSTRREKAFVAVNCASIPETLFEREFFGHRRGAFTGADRDKPGLFDRAHQGVLFLDEVTELTPGAQAKLLRALQDGEYTPIGSTQVKQADVLIVAATNKDPQEEIAQKRLRADFFYRICVIEIALPPLRERKDDLPLLVEHFLEQAREKQTRKRGSAASYDQSLLPGELMQALYSYAWPGNVRELQNILQRYLATQDLSAVLSLMSLAQSRASIDSSEQAEEPQSLADAVQRLEKRVIAETLERNAYHVESSAEQLDLTARTLYRKIKQYNLWQKKYMGS